VCIFITAVVPVSASIEALQPLVADHHKALTPVDNRYVQSQLRADEAYFLTTTRFCDCGTSLGGERRAGSRPKKHGARRLAVLRNRGWGEAKIARWLAEQAQTEAREQRIQAARKLGGPNQDLEEWRALLSDLLVQPGVGWVGLLIHWYRGGPSTERIDIARREGVPLDDSAVRRLGEMGDDVLYVFHRPARP
jgi:hypothetical protein